MTTNLRAVRPMSESIVKAANDVFYAANPQMVVNGRRVPLDPLSPHHAVMRRQWLDGYAANGGTVVAASAQAPAAILRASGQFLSVLPSQSCIQCLTRTANSTPPTVASGNSVFSVADAALNFADIGSKIASTPAEMAAGGRAFSAGLTPGTAASHGRAVVGATPMAVALDKVGPALALAESAFVSGTAFFEQDYTQKLEKSSKALGTNLSIVSSLTVGFMAGASIVVAVPTAPAVVVAGVVLALGYVAKIVADAAWSRWGDPWIKKKFAPPR